MGRAAEAAAAAATEAERLHANKLSALLPFVRRSRGLALMSALSVPTPLRLNELVSLPILARASLARGIQVQAMRDRRLPKAVRAFLRELTDALAPLAGTR